MGVNAGFTLLKLKLNTLFLKLLPLLVTRLLLIVRLKLFFYITATVTIPSRVFKILLIIIILDFISGSNLIKNI